MKMKPKYKIDLCNIGFYRYALYVKTWYGWVVLEKSDSINRLENSLKGLKELPILFNENGEKI